MKLVTVADKKIIDLFKENKDISLVYPLCNYTVGYVNTFDINAIDDFCLINRILTDKELDELEILLKNSNIKGIIFDDLGILDVIKDLNITKILLLDHISNNSESINYYLDYVDSVVVSTDISKEEIEYILNNSKKELVLNIFALKGLMYSRRLLITNYNKHYQANENKVLKAKIDSKDFIFVENEYGTKAFSFPYYFAKDLYGHENVMYYWYDVNLLDSELVYDLVINNNADNIKTDSFFLDNETFYKVGD